MRPTKLIPALLAVLALATSGASYAAGAASPAPGAKKLLKRRVPKPSPVVIVSYEPAGEITPGVHYALEGSLVSIKSYLSNTGQPSGNKSKLPPPVAKGLPISMVNQPKPLGPIP